VRGEDLDHVVATGDRAGIGRQRAIGEHEVGDALERAPLDADVAQPRRQVELGDSRTTPCTRPVARATR